MSDPNQDLGETDSEEGFEYPPAEQKISTQPYDISLQTLSDQWESKELVIPPIQREYVWDKGRASRLIESLLLNIPVPPVYFAETEESILEIVDGHQRVASIVDYLDNKFPLSKLPILDGFKDKRYYQLPETEQRRLRTRTLRAIVIGRDSHPNMKFEVFERLNTGGLALNAQELRNSLYRGRLNDLLHRLARECRPFRAMIGGKTPRRRMVDQELILRWFAFRDRLKHYKPPLKRYLNEYMRENRNPSDSWLSTRSEHFAQTMVFIHSILGGQAFRLIDENGEPLRDKEGKVLPRGVNRALFDAQAIACSYIDSDEGSVSRTAVVRNISAQLKDGEFQDAVRRATGDRARVRLRIARMVEALESGGVSVKPLPLPQ